MKQLSPHITWTILGAILGFALCTAPVISAAPVTAELRARMAASGAGGQVPVIVRFADRYDIGAIAHRHDRAAARAEMLHGLREQARASQGQLQAFLRRQGVEGRELWLINALAVSVLTSLVPTLASWPGVAAVELDGEIPPPEPIVLAVPTATNYSLAALGVSELWDAGFTGSGVVVASFDTGVDVNHPDLSGRWRGGTNSWFDPHTASTQPYDRAGTIFTGHGTATTSLMIAGALSGQAIGVAPDAQWIAAKIYSDAGVTSTSAIIRSFQWALDPDLNPSTDDAPQVINNSWGYETESGQCVEVSEPGNGSLSLAIGAAQTAGIHVVFSAGNGGPAAATSVSPANYPEGLAVGSIGSSYAISSTSARGPNACTGSIYDDLAADVYPELVAPGEQVLVAMPSASYAQATGTSYSAPYVSGSLALLRSAVPPGVTESATDYRLRLERSLLSASADLGPLGADNSYGRGLVNLPAAYDRLTAQPHLSVYDPTAPENNNGIDFGPVTPGAFKDLAFVLKNVGGNDLTLNSIDSSGLPGPELSLVGNTCPTQLPSGGECTLTVRFAPVDFASFSGQINIASNDPRPALPPLLVTGAGNTLPPAAQLFAPASGTAGLAVPVTFSWIQAPDHDGDVLTMILSIDRDADFSPPVDRVFPDLVVGTTAVLVAAMTVFLVGPFRNRRRLFLVATLLLALWIVVACGGDGGGGGGVTVLGPNSSRTVDNLDPATTYYWKVRTTDSHGGVSESDIWSFTTR